MSPSSHMILQDRPAAGRRLVAPLLAYANRPDVIVLALPRGGVPVAYEVATALDVRLDLMLVRKLGVPSHEEFAMGAIASGGIQILNQQAPRVHPIDQAAFDAVVARETRELLRCEVDELVCPIMPEWLMSIGHWYMDFSQTSDAEVMRLLQRAWAKEDSSRQ